jgi:hypothetical protein
MENVDTIWYTVRSFDLFSGNLVYFVGICYIIPLLVYCFAKNLAALVKKKFQRISNSFQFEHFRQGSVVLKFLLNVFEVQYRCLSMERRILN